MNEFKILLLGSDRVGKTTCFKSFIGELIDISYLPTLTVNIGYKILDINNSQIGLRIWDLGGQVFLRDSLSNYYPGTDGCILIYDVTRRYTFNDIINWKEELSKFLDKNIPFILVGNKSDLESERQVKYQEGESLQNQLDIDAFFEISALYNINNKDIFEKIAFILINQ